MGYQVISYYITYYVISHHILSHGVLLDKSKSNQVLSHYILSHCLSSRLVLTSWGHTYGMFAEWVSISTENLSPEALSFEQEFVTVERPSIGILLSLTVIPDMVHSTILQAATVSSSSRYLLTELFLSLIRSTVLHIGLQDYPWQG